MSAFPRALPAAMSALMCMACAGSPTGAPGPGAENSGASSRDETTAESAAMCAAPQPGCAIPPDVPVDEGARSVLGNALEVCSEAPLTGFRRSGRCETGPADRGVHVVCASMTEAFLEYTRGQGNDLSTPRPEYNFPGLRRGDAWCLCASRWVEAQLAGVAPPVHLGATDAAALRYTSLENLQEHAAP